jgi:hypothetical protein
MVYTTDLKSVASNGLRVQVPPLVPCPVSSVDRAMVFYTTGREFESLTGRQLCRWSQLDGHWIANPWKQVRFLSPTPVSC